VSDEQDESEHELPEMPTAAEVISVGGTPKEGAAIQNFVQITEGDKLVTLKDAEERIQELNSTWANRLENAVKQERRRIQEKIEEYVDGIEKEIERVKEEKKEKSDSNLNIALMHHRMQKSNLEELEEELRGETTE